MSTFGFLPNGSYVQPTQLISNVYVNTNFDMNNKNINNLADSVQSSPQQALTRQQGYRIGEMFQSPSLTLTNHYNYILACQGQSFDSNLYPELYARMGNTNVLPNMRASNELIIYDNIPNSGSNNFMSLTWLQARVYAQYIRFESYNVNSLIMFSSIIVNTDNIQNGGASSFWGPSKRDSFTGFFDQFTLRMNNDQNSNAFDFSFVNNINGLRIKIILFDIKTGPLERVRTYIIAK